MNDIEITEEQIAQEMELFGLVNEDGCEWENEAEIALFQESEYGTELPF